MERYLQNLYVSPLVTSKSQSVLGMCQTTTLDKPLFLGACAECADCVGYCAYTRM